MDRGGSLVSGREEVLKSNRPELVNLRPVTCSLCNLMDLNASLMRLMCEVHMGVSVGLLARCLTQDRSSVTMGIRWDGQV